MKYSNPLLIYNPNAGGGRAKKRVEKIKDLLINQCGLYNLSIYETQSPKDAFQRVATMVSEKKIDLVISIGGDGTISEILNSLMTMPKEDRPVFMPIPGGSGNSLLRDFSILTAEDAIKKFQAGSTRFLDSLFVESPSSNFSWHCFNILGMGFISDIARYVVDNGKKLGAFSYILGLFLTLGNFRAYSVKIKGRNDEVLFESDKSYFLTVSNSKCSGGSIMIAPDAIVDDGLMDVCVLHDMNRAYFLKGFLKALKGKHTGMRGCKSFRAEYIEIESDPIFKLMPDGELEGLSPVKVTVLPSQIRIIA